MVSHCKNFRTKYSFQYFKVSNQLINDLALTMAKKYKTAKWYRDYMREYIRKYRKKERGK